MNALRCSRCHTALIPGLVDSGGGSCNSCGGDVAVAALPASRGEVVRSAKLTAVEEGEASCFYAPERLATGICGVCGVFVSELWSADWGSEIVCLKCLDRLRSGKPDARFESRRTLWDNICLAIAAGPVVLPFFWFVSLFTAPVALLLLLLHWRKPGSMLPGFRWRRWLALLLVVVQVVAWVALFIAGSVDI